MINEFMSVANPGFTQWVDGNSPGGHQITISPNVPEKCMKLKEIGHPGGGAPLTPPLNLPLCVAI